MASKNGSERVDAIQRREEVPLLNIGTGNNSAQITTSNKMTADSFNLSGERAKSGETGVRVSHDEEDTHEIFNCMKLTALDKICAILAELLGAFLLLFIGCMACQGGLSAPPPMLHVALAFGLAIMVGAQALGHISGGHFNPAVTVAAMIFKVTEIPIGLAYIVAQLVGGILGYGALKLVSTNEIMYPKGEEEGGLCITVPADGLSTFQAFLVEFIGTSILVLVICGLWDPRNRKNTDSTPLRAGLTVAVLVLITGPYTGASLNPARSFGPAVWTGDWQDHWIYWVAPTLGGAVTSLIYKTLFYRSVDLDD